jgi:hypothetical protein
MKERRRRALFVLIVALVASVHALAGGIYEHYQDRAEERSVLSTNQQEEADTELALDVLATLEVKGRAPKTGYSRAEFGDGWAIVGRCDMRNLILKRDLSEPTLADDDCTVLAGTLHDPYTGKVIQFSRGTSTSQAVQIDHIVALSDAWQKGAQGLSFERREQFANDPLNLLAVDGPANQQKGDGDAATWLPPERGYRCRFVARQIAVKAKYELWITHAEKDAISRVLNTCPTQRLPFANG